MGRNAVLFVTVSMLSGFGSGAMNLVAGIWTLELTGSSGLAALTGICVYGPVFAAPWLGGLVDRLPRRRLVVTVNLMLAASLLSLLAVRGPAQTWLLFLVTGCYGISYVLVDAGETALLPAALSRTALADVNGWRSSAQEGMKLVAPLAGAALYTWRGGHAVAVLSAAMPLLAAVGYLMLRLPRPDVAARRGPAPGRGARAGFAVLVGHPTIRTTVALAAVAIAMSGFTTAALYSVVTTGLGLPATFLGVLVSAQGLGSIAGGLVVGRLTVRLGAVRVGVAGTVLFAVGCLARCLPWSPAVVAASVVAGVGLPWVLVAAVTAVQTHAPAALLGRAAATANTAMFGPVVAAIPLGSALVGLGSRPVLVAAGMICLLGAVAATRRPGPGRRQRRTAGAAAPGTSVPAASCSAQQRR